MDPVTAALVVGGSAAMSAVSASKGWSNWRTQRKRIHKNLAYGRGLYGMAIDQALDLNYRNVARAQEIGAQQMGDVNAAELAATQDIDTLLQQQVAASRTGAGSVLAQSSALPQRNRGFYEGAARSKIAARGQFGLMRAGVRGEAGGRELNARSALAGALLSSGAAKYGMWQDAANVWLQAPQQSSGGINLGGLAMLSTNMFGNTNTGGWAPGGPSAGGQNEQMFNSGAV